MMLWSSGCDYAIRALTHLAARRDALVALKDLAAEESIPAPFVSKILQHLVKAGIVRSVKGPRGGYGLALAPRAVTLLAVKAAIDGTRDLEACAVGLGPCSDQLPCPLHDQFKPIRRAIQRYLETTTVADMTTAITRKRALLGRTGRLAGGRERRRARSA